MYGVDPPGACRHSALSLLRTTTEEIHLRLHGHQIFAPIMHGRADCRHYQKLLAALYGFHQGYEEVSGTDVVRSADLKRDLLALHVAPCDIERIRVATLPRLRSASARWGAAYVVEGSALGGRVLARQLNELLGAGAVDGRRFFLSAGRNAGADWRNFVARMEAALQTPEKQAIACDAALTTFLFFEDWMTSFARGPDAS